MTLAISVSTGWIIGWAVALVVVLIAALLLLAIIGLGRRITRQAEAITQALDGARANTTPMFEIPKTNLTLDQITRGLRKARGG